MNKQINNILAPVSLNALTVLQDSETHLYGHIITTDSLLCLLGKSLPIFCKSILGDPGADRGGGMGKSKWLEKYGIKKSKERREEPLGTMSYQTSSKRSPPFWFLIGARKLLCFSAQSEARTVATIWNRSGKTLSPGALLAVLYFSSCYIFLPV